MLESGLEKKAGINYAPPANRQLIYFVDDLNLPRLDPYETAMVGGAGGAAGLPPCLRRGGLCGCCLRPSLHVLRASSTWLDRLCCPCCGHACLVASLPRSPSR